MIISLNVELPEDLASALASYLAASRGVSQDDVISQAIAQFLMQQGCSDRAVVQVYLEGVWQ